MGNPLVNLSTPFRIRAISAGPQGILPCQGSAMSEPDGSPKADRQESRMVEAASADSTSSTVSGLPDFQ